VRPLWGAPRVAFDCMRVLLFTAAVTALAVLSPAQNSNRRIRTTPSALAARVGSAVNWRADLEASLAEAKKRQTLVFWYVSTINRSPMDRKTEIDRYSMIGPFLWPPATSFLNEHFIPVRMAAGKEECKTHGLEQLVFVEPGWIVLDQGGREVAREHQITTPQDGKVVGPGETAGAVGGPLEFRSSGRQTQLITIG